MFIFKPKFMIPLALGTPLKAADLLIKQWPEDLVPDSSFQDMSEVIGRVMKTEVIAGEPILSTKLAPTGSGGGVPGLIPSGMRAFTKTILQNVEVLAIDQTYNKNNDADPVVVKSVTLVVSPDEAEKLALAGNEGKLQLVLRNGTDLEMRNTDGVKISQFNGRVEPQPQLRVIRPQPAPEEVEEEEAPVRVVEVIRANVRSEIAFEPNGATKKKTSKQ